MTTVQPIPLTILTGFLGAGKTTLLNRLLSERHGMRVAVLVNDFGAVNIDAELVVGVEGNAISLANGCVCCSIRQELVDTVRAVLARPQPPEYLLLEASGVADPTAIAMSFVLGGFRDSLRLDTILCVIDAAHFFDTPEQMSLKTRQIAFADLLLLNKVDLVEPAELERIRTWVGARVERPRLIETSRCDVPLEVVIESRLGSARKIPFPLEVSHCHDPSCRNPDHNHGQGFVSWNYESDHPHDLAALRTFAQNLPTEIYRAKGVFYAASAPERRGILQVVGRRVDLTWGEPWGDEPPATRIVVIGASAMDEAALRQGLSTAAIDP